MTSRLANLLAAAAVLAGSLPVAALANDRGPDCDHEGRPVVVAPAPFYPAPAPREDWRAHVRYDRREAWRERELASVRHELRVLDAARADFYARHSGRPGQLRRYDRGYFAQRAELERRMSELQRVAWR